MLESCQLWKIHVLTLIKLHYLCFDVILSYTNDFPWTYSTLTEQQRVPPALHSHISVWEGSHLVGKLWISLWISLSNKMNSLFYLYNDCQIVQTFADKMHWWCSFQGGKKSYIVVAPGIFDFTVFGEMTCSYRHKVNRPNQTSSGCCRDNFRFGQNYQANFSKSCCCAKNLQITLIGNCLEIE